MALLDSTRPLFVAVAAVLGGLLTVGCEAPSVQGSSLDGTSDTKRDKGEGSPEGDERQSDDELRPQGAPQEGERGDDEATTESPNAPVTCTTDAQCGGTGRICESSQCIKGCRDDSGCTTGQSCTEQICSKKATAVDCAVDEECVLGKICTASACVAGCHSTFDCPLQESCVAGQCSPDPTPAPGNDPAPVGCISHGQCNPGNNGSGLICSAAGKCVPGCTKDYHCPNVEICVAGQCQ